MSSVIQMLSVSVIVRPGRCSKVSGQSYPLHEIADAHDRVDAGVRGHVFVDIRTLHGRHAFGPVE